MGKGRVFLFLSIETIKQQLTLCVCRFYWFKILKKSGLALQIIFIVVIKTGYVEFALNGRLTLSWPG